jgi:hypothetical protein
MIPLPRPSHMTTLQGEKWFVLLCTLPLPCYRVTNSYHFEGLRLKFHLVPYITCVKYLTSWTVNDTGQGFVLDDGVIRYYVYRTLLTFVSDRPNRTCYRHILRSGQQTTRWPRRQRSKDIERNSLCHYETSRSCS